MSQFLFFSRPTKWEIEGYLFEPIKSDEVIQRLSKYVGSKHGYNWFTLRSTVSDNKEACFECHFDRYFQYEDGKDHLGRTIDQLVLAIMVVSEALVFVYGQPDDELSICRSKDSFLTPVARTMSGSASRTSLCPGQLLDHLHRRRGRTQTLSERPKLAHLRHWLESFR